MDKTIKNIAVAGAGGIGSHLTGMLFDFGVNRGQFNFTDLNITVFDDDTVDHSNLLHQNFTDADIGNYKVNSLAERYLITPETRFMTKEDFPNYDLIFCGVDCMVFRKQLYEWSWEQDTFEKLWIDGRCTSRAGALYNSTVKKETLLKVLNDQEERNGCLLAYEKENKVSHTLPIIVAGMMVQTFLNYLRGAKPLSEKTFII